MTVIGVGRAGSFAVLAAAMTGVRRIRLYDHDHLDPRRNLAVQLYRSADIEAGRPKVEALRELVEAIVPGVTIGSHAERFEGRRDQPTDPVVLLAVDTMGWRASLAKRLARRRNLGLLIDLRLGGSVMQCLLVRGRDELDWYRSTLYDDSEAWGAPCAESPEAHVAVGAAAFAAGAITAWLRGGDFPRRLAIDFDSAGFLSEAGRAGAPPHGSPPTGEGPTRKGSPPAALRREPPDRADSP